jgi:hypothetical protein
MFDTAVRGILCVRTVRQGVLPTVRTRHFMLQHVHVRIFMLRMRMLRQVDPILALGQGEDVREGFC